MKIGYVRVSSKDQNEARQVEALKAQGVEEFYEEKISGKDTNRPQLKALQVYARKGDTIYIESISRLARNTLDFLHLVEQFTAKGVQLVSLKENIDTSTPQGKFMLSVFAALSQLERDTIKQRQREGIDIAIAEGKAYGRPKLKMDSFKAIYDRWKSGEVTAVKAMEVLCVSKNTFYRRVKELEEQAK